MKKPVSLSGIKPSGTPHLGNYLGFIKPALEMVQDYQALYFIADYHALTTVREPNRLVQQTYEVAATWLALGLDPKQVVFYRQSDIPEVFELAWILACIAPKGLLNRAHAYKAAVESNVTAGKSADEGINSGLFNYPVLMAADILLFGTQVVPVGLDQVQHVETARDIAESFNRIYGSLLTLPEAMVQDNVKTIPGVDGRKMSKNYANIVPIFDHPDHIRKRIMRILTDSKRPADPKDPEKCAVFGIYRHFASPEAVERMRRKYLQGGLAYSDMKLALFEQLQSTFQDAARRYDRFIGDHRQIEDILKRGAEKARQIAAPNLARIRQHIGIR